MLLGVPCISTEVGGIPSLFDGGRDGLWCRGHQLSEVAENDKYASDASESKNNMRNYKTTKTEELENIVNSMANSIIEMWSFRRKCWNTQKMQENMQEKPMIKSRISQNCRKYMQT